MMKLEPTFRLFQNEDDYTLMHFLYLESIKADQVIDNASLEDIRSWCAPSERLDPKHDILFALDDEGKEIGFSRLSWYTGKDEVRLYTQASYLLPEARKPGAWSEMVKANERRLREIAARNPGREQFFQSWATEIQKEWISVLENEGFTGSAPFQQYASYAGAYPQPGVSGWHRSSTGPG